MLEVSSAEALNGALLVAMKIFFGLPVYCPEAVVKVGALVEVFYVFLVAGEVFTFDAKADIKLVFVGVFGALDETDIEIELALRHADDLPKSVWHGAVAREDDAF